MKILWVFQSFQTVLVVGFTSLEVFLTLSSRIRFLIVTKSTLFEEKTFRTGFLPEPAKSCKTMHYSPQKLTRSLQESYSLEDFSKYN